MNWKLITDTEPPIGEIVLTKIDDAQGERNVQPLKRTQRPGCRSLWWFADGSMYVYYEPTHYATDTEAR